ncbi:MAG TPA: site-specific integrase [Terriglobales bacterium]|nr:site-specific integrase [Terriglobales bacterium]
MKRRKKREQGHIAKRGENKYLVRWRIDGKQVSKIVDGDYGRAVAFLADKLNNRERGASSRSERTFERYVSNEWSHYMRDKWKESTRTTQGTYVKKHIAPYFGPMKLADIKPITIVAFHESMEAKGLAKKTRRNLHAILTRMFSYALELELIEKTPIKSGLAPKQDKTEKPALTEQQLSEVLSSVQPKLKAFYMTLALTGIRAGEALGLKWEDVDFADSVLNIRRAIYRGKETTPKTSSSLRPRPMVPELRQALLNHKTMAVYSQPSNYVFASSSGRPLNPDMLREHLQSALRMAKVEFALKRADGLHLLRHTSGSLIYRRSGGDLKTTQEWLGHSSSRVTADVYVHLHNEAQRNAAETLSRAVFAKHPAPAREHYN